MTKPTFPEKFWMQLAENNPIGMLLEPADAEAWFDFVWLRYSTYGYRSHRRAIINWWSRVTEPEILKARERVARIQDECETAALEDIASRRETATVVPIDFAARLTGERGADVLRPRKAPSGGKAGDQRHI
jgi:hypothetical protein